MNIKESFEHVGFTPEEKMDLTARLERAAEGKETMTNATKRKLKNISGGMLFGVAAAALGGTVRLGMPWFLSFAAGAMIYVVVQELIPEACAGEEEKSGTLGFVVGFLVMMILDVALGTS